MKEDKITYEEGNNIRVVRGKISGNDDCFIIVRRMDGEIRLNKNNIVKIEEE